MKVISLHQPYATLLACGLKKYETRTWQTKHRGAIAIHAAKTWTKQRYNLCLREPFATLLARAGHSFDTFPPTGDGLTPTLGLPLGAIVGLSIIEDCISILPFSRRHVSDVEKAVGDWSDGNYAWRVEEPSRLFRPIRYRGRQGIHDLPAVIAASILASTFMPDCR